MYLGYANLYLGHALFGNLLVLVHPLFIAADRIDGTLALPRMAYGCPLRQIALAPTSPPTWVLASARYDAVSFSWYHGGL